MAIKQRTPEEIAAGVARARTDAAALQKAAATKAIISGADKATIQRASQNAVQAAQSAQEARDRAANTQGTLPQPTPSTDKSGLFFGYDINKALEDFKMPSFTDSNVVDPYKDLYAGKSPVTDYAPPLPIGAKGVQNKISIENTTKLPSGQPVSPFAGVETAESARAKAEADFYTKAEADAKRYLEEAQTKHTTDVTSQMGQYDEILGNKYTEKMNLADTNMREAVEDLMRFKGAASVLALATPAAISSGVLCLIAISLSFKLLIIDTPSQQLIRGIYIMELKAEMVMTEWTEKPGIF